MSSPELADIELVCTDGDIAARFEECAIACGLAVARHKLAKYRGCIHWHLTMPGDKGTLEATWWPSRNRLWLSQRANRKGDWQDDAMTNLSRRFGVPQG